MALRIAILCVSAAVICVFIRVNRPEIAMVIGLCAGLTACLLAIGELEPVIRVIRTALGSAGLEDGERSLILRACGLTLIGEYASQLCRDAGEGALAQRIDFGMRISLLALAAPAASELIILVTELSV